MSENAMRSRQTSPERSRSPTDSSGGSNRSNRVNTEVSAIAPGIVTLAESEDFMEIYLAVRDLTVRFPTTANIELIPLRQTYGRAEWLQTVARSLPVDTEDTYTLNDFMESIQTAREELEEVKQRQKEDDVRRAVESAVREKETSDKELMSDLLDEMTGDVRNLVKAEEERDKYKTQLRKLTAMVKEKLKEEKGTKDNAKTLIEKISPLGTPEEVDTKGEQSEV